MSVHTLEYSPDGLFLMARVEITVKIWRVSDGSVQTVPLDPQAKRHGCASFSPNGQLIATGSNDGIVRFWTMNDRVANCFALSPHVHGDDHDHDGRNDPATDVYSVAFTPNGQHLASGGQDGNIFLWDTREFL
jgi:WD40 repeat protein